MDWPIHLLWNAFVEFVGPDRPWWAKTLLYFAPFLLLALLIGMIMVLLS